MDTLIRSAAGWGALGCRMVITGLLALLLAPGAARAADDNTIAPDELAAWLPEPVVPDGVYALRRGRDPLGAAPAVLLAGAVVRLAGESLRIENIVLDGERQGWLDYALRLSGAVAYVPTGWGDGVPAEAPVAGAGARLDTTASDAYLYGPPLGLAVLPLRAAGGGSDHEALFELASDGSLRLTSLRPIAPVPAPMPRSRATAEAAIDAWIAEQTLVEVGLPDDGALAATLQDCAGKLLDALTVPYASDVLRALAASPTLVAEVRETLATGEVNDSALLLARYVNKALVDLAPDGSRLAATLDALNEHAGGLAGAAGASCGADWKRGVRATVQGIGAELLPLASCGLGAIHDTARGVRNWLADQAIRTHYLAWKNQGITLTLAGAPDLVASYARKMGTDLGRSVTSEQAEAAIVTLFTRWRAAEAHAPQRVAWLQRMKALYLALDVRQRDALARRVAGAGDPARVDEAARFAKFLALFHKTRQQLAPYRPTDLNRLVSTDAMDDSARLAVQALLDSGVPAWRAHLAATLQLWSGATRRPSARTCNLPVEKAWVLVEVTDFGQPPSGNYELGYARGSIAWRYSLGQDVFAFTSTWSAPPAVIRGSDRVTIDMAVSITQNVGNYYSVNGNFDVWFDAAYVEPGGVSRPIAFTNAQGQSGNIAVSHLRPNTGPLSLSVWLDAASLPAGVDGARIALLAHAYIGRSAGTRYTYAWQALE